MDIDDEVVGREFPLENYGSNAERFADMMKYIDSLEEKIRIQSLEARLAAAERTKIALCEQAAHRQQLAELQALYVHDVSSAMSGNKITLNCGREVLDRHLAKSNLNLLLSLRDNANIDTPPLPKAEEMAFDAGVEAVGRLLTRQIEVLRSSLGLSVETNIDTFREESRVLAESSSPAPNAP